MDYCLLFIYCQKQVILLISPAFNIVRCHIHLFFSFCISYFSALVKLMNKSIEGTADDEEEGVSPDTAIRAGLELLKVIYVNAPIVCNGRDKSGTTNKLMLAWF